MAEHQLHKTTLFILAVIVAVAAVSYFSLTYVRIINPDDEGYLLYNYQKTAEGQVPHRDFYDDYGPAIYWLGGSLFKYFGSNLIVIRVFVLALKTAMALLIFLIGRKLVPPAFALLASLFFIITWGDPYFPAFNILYAGFVSHFLALLGILFMIEYVERENRLWLMGTAVCLGMSALIKFHAAIFDFIGFSVFLSLRGGAVGIAARAEEASDLADAARPSLLLRAGKLLGAPAVAIFYLTLFARDHLDPYYFFIFLFPYFLLLAHIFASDLKLMRGGQEKVQRQNGLKNCYVEIFMLACGVSVFIVFTLLYYYRVGGLEELLYDTFALPVAMRFFKPMDNYRLIAGLIAAAVILVLVLAWIARRLRGRGEGTGEIFWTACLLLVLMIPVSLSIRNISIETWHKYTIYLVSPIALMLCSYILISAWRREQLAGHTTRETLVLGLVFIFACQGYLAAFPRTDPTHVQVNCTVILVLLSFLLWKLYGEWSGSSSMRGKVRGMILTAAVAVILAAPFLLGMQKFYGFSPELPDRLKMKLPTEVLYALETGTLSSYPETHYDFPRASDMKFPMWPVPPFHSFVMGEAAETVHFIRDNTTSDEKIFVMCESQMMYFLAERDNFLQKENYFIFLAVVQLIDRADRVRLSDERLTQRLIEEKPRFVVGVLKDFGDQTQRIATIWPGAAAYIKNNYRRVAKIGVYEVFEPRDFMKGRKKSDAGNNRRSLPAE